MSSQETASTSRPRRRISRRTLVVSSGAAAAGSMLIPTEGVFASSIRRASIWGRLPVAYDSFAQTLGSTFRFSYPGGVHALKLARATQSPPQILRQPTANGMTRIEHFSLIFTSGGRLLPQGTYRVYHSRFGYFLLFIVPVGSDGATHEYEAVFNRMFK